MRELDTTALENFLRFNLSTETQGDVACALLHQAIAAAQTEVVGAETIVEIEPDEKPLTPPPLLFPEGCDHVPSALDIPRTMSPQPRRQSVLLVGIALMSLFVGFCFGSRAQQPIETGQAQTPTPSRCFELPPDTPVCAPLMPNPLPKHPSRPPRLAKKAKSRHDRKRDPEKFYIPTSLNEVANENDRPDLLDQLIERM